MTLYPGDIVKIRTLLGKVAVQEYFVQHVRDSHYVLWRFYRVQKGGFIADLGTWTLGSFRKRIWTG